MKIEVGSTVISVTGKGNDKQTDNNSQSKSTRKVRCDKKIRVNPPLEQETHARLERLALACGIYKTPLAGEIIKMFLNDADMVIAIQDKFKADRYRVIPVVNNGEVYY